MIATWYADPKTTTNDSGSEIRVITWAFPTINFAGFAFPSNGGPYLCLRFHATTKYNDLCCGNHETDSCFEFRSPNGFNGSVQNYHLAACVKGNLSN